MFGRATASIRSPLDREGLEALYAELRRDPEEQRRFRSLYAGPMDAMDVLRWNLEPESRDDPDVQIPELELLAFARPATPDAGAQRAAESRLRELRDASLAAERELILALRRYLEPPAVSRMHRLVRSRWAWFVAGALATAVVAAVLTLTLPLTVPPSPLEVFDRPQGIHDAAMAERSGAVNAEQRATVRVVYDDAARDEVLLAWINETQVCLTLVRLERERGTACAPLDGFGGMTFGEYRWGPVGLDAVRVER